MRDSSAMPRGDAVSVPSAAEVEHADWPTLQRMCESLGLNPKGRSEVVRMRVLDHVRRRTRPESWRAGRDHMAALLTRLGFPNLSEDLWESTIRLDAPAPWVGLGQAQVAGGFLSEAAKSFDRAAQMGDRSALLHRAEALGAGGDYDRAIAACESYLADRPGNLRALGMKADFLARSGFKEEAARVLLAAADSHPEAPFLRSSAGTSFLKAGRPESGPASSSQEACRKEETEAIGPRFGNHQYRLRRGGTDAGAIDAMGRRLCRRAVAPHPESRPRCRRVRRGSRPRERRRVPSVGREPEQARGVSEARGSRMAG